MATLASILTILSEKLPTNALSSIVRGIEKENCRVDLSGNLAQTEHPKALGKTLTNPNITTDFSESLPELITPPLTGITTLQNYLLTLNRFVYDQLDHETLWPFSMPPQINDENDVAIAQYGQSNTAQMKTIYRVGLSYRYGRIMQAIAGIHFNLSFPDKLFQALKTIENNQDNFHTFRSSAYMKLTRHFHCHAWLLPYLFGASPLCFNSSMPESKDYLEAFDKDTHYAPWGTSLRMSDLGYQNNVQDSLKVSYENVENYATSLLKATQELNEAFEKIGVKVDGAYKQLNANTLQIENEYYSFIRPKPSPKHNERPAVALQKHGVEYIEVRLLDLNPSLPLGLDEEAIAFLDLFLLFCLIADCCNIRQDCDSARENFKRVTTCGRDPHLKLLTGHGELPFKEVALSLLNEMAPLAKWMDENISGERYQRVLTQQIDKVNHPELTPSATLLSDIKKSKLSYQDFCLAQAKKQADIILSADYDEPLYATLKKTAAQSLVDWQETEKAPKNFDDFLKNYFYKG